MTSYNAPKLIEAAIERLRSAEEHAKVIGDFEAIKVSAETISYRGDDYYGDGYERSPISRRNYNNYDDVEVTITLVLPSYDSETASFAETFIQAKENVDEAERLAKIAELEQEQRDIADRLAALKK